MKKMHKSLSLLLTLAMLLTLLPVFGTGANADGETTVETADALKTALSAASSTSTVKLMADISVGASKTQTTIAATSTITLDLNGHSITRASATNCYLLVGGTLTIMDSSGSGAGYITATNTSTSSDYKGGAISVKSGGTLNLQSGSFDGCSTTLNGGAIAVLSGGIFNMTGGTITGCTATGNGGGVYNTGTFTMTGGSIKNCTAKNGGGLYQTAGTFIMQKDAIMASKIINYSKGTGVVTVSGGWYMADCGSYAASGYTATGKCADAPDTAAPYTVASAENYTITYATGNSVAMTAIEPSTTAHGTATELPTTAEAEGYSFVSWNTKEDGTGASVAGEVEFSTDTTLYAQWVSAAKNFVKLSSNGNEYGTIAVALENAGENDTLTLLDNTMENVTIASGKSVTLDLAGKTLTGKGDASVITVAEGGALTLSDSSEGETGTVTGGKASNGAGLDICGTVVMTGGTVYQNDSTAKTKNGSQVRVQRVAGETPASFTMTGGTIVGEEKDENNLIYAQGGNDTMPTGGVITVSGGYLSSKVSESYLAENCFATGARTGESVPEDAPYTVVSDKTGFIAQLGSTVYETLSEAVGSVSTSAEKASTVTLLAATCENITIPAGAKVILDLAGKTLTNDGTAGSKTITVAKATDEKAAAELTVTDSSEGETGAIDGAASGYGIYSYGTLTLAGGTIQNCVGAGGNGRAVYNYGGTLNITGGVIENCDETDTSGETPTTYKTVNNYIKTGKAYCNISGGEIRGSIAGTNTAWSITGGSFAEKPIASRLSEGYIAVKRVDAYAVVQDYTYTLDETGLSVAGDAIEDGETLWAAFYQESGKLLSTAAVTAGGDAVALSEGTATVKVFFLDSSFRPLREAKELTVPEAPAAP